jgi:hypothetical protein
MKAQVVQKGPDSVQEPSVPPERQIRITTTSMLIRRPIRDDEKRVDQSNLIGPIINERKFMRKNVLASVALLATISCTGFAFAGIEEAKKWVEKEFQPSTLSKEEQMKEMEWFIKAAEPFKGMEINVLSETVPTHTYESEVLTTAFEDITGIKVNH